MSDNLFEDQLRQAMEASRNEANRAADEDFERQLRQATQASMGDSQAREREYARQLQQATETSMSDARTREQDHERQIQATIDASRNDNPIIQQDHQRQLRDAFQTSVAEQTTEYQRQLEEATQASIRNLPPDMARQDEDFREDPDYMEKVSSLLADQRVRQALAQAAPGQRPALERTTLQEAMSYQDARMLRTRAGRNPDEVGPFLPTLLRQQGAGPPNQAVGAAVGSENQGNKTTGLRRGAPEAITRNQQQRSEPRASPNQKTCLACTESVATSDAVTTACKHDYCKDCIQRMFTMALTDESLFPPKCCGRPIPLDTARRFLDRNATRSFAEKQVEFGTQKRTYCYRPQCSAFIPPAQIRDDVGTCPSCSAHTCTICKAHAHQGQDCPQDEDLQKLLEHADEKKWRRCTCGRVVERVEGCNQILCPCSRQFCYICGTRWGKCHCPLWTEADFHARAEEIAQLREAVEIAANGPRVPQYHPRRETWNLGPGVFPKHTGGVNFYVDQMRAGFQQALPPFAAHQPYVNRYLPPPRPPAAPAPAPAPAPRAAVAPPRLINTARGPPQAQFLATPAKVVANQTLSRQLCEHSVLWKMFNRTNVGQHCSKCDNKKSGRTWRCQCGLELCSGCLLKQKDFQLHEDLLSRIYGPHANDGNWFTNQQVGWLRRSSTR